MGKKWVLTMSAFSPRDLLSSSPREPLRSAWKYVSFHSLICINFSHYTRKWPHVSPAQSGGLWRPAAAYHGRRRRHQLPRSPLPASFQAGWRPVTGPARPAGPRPPQLDLLAVTEPPPAAEEGGGSFEPASITLPWESERRMILSGFWFPVFVQH